MQKRIWMFLLVIGSMCYYSFSQEANPLSPGSYEGSYMFGINGGIIYPLSPSELTKKPNVYSASEKSLMNGLDGLGYMPNVNFGLNFQYPLNKNFWLGGNLSYTNFSSSSKCNCPQNVVPVYNSTNSISIIQLSAIPYYYLENRLYFAPEINFNYIPVSVQETNSQRTSIDFKKNYFRLGVGLAIGIDFPLNFINQKLLLDLALKGQLPNLILAKKDDRATPESEAVVKSAGTQTEALIGLISFNIGLFYSFK